MRRLIVPAGSCNSAIHGTARGRDAARDGDRHTVASRSPRRRSSMPSLRGPGLDRGRAALVDPGGLRLCPNLTLAAQRRGGLFVVVSHHLAGRPVDQVHPRAGKTGHGFVDLVVVTRRVIGEPSLHIQSRRGTSIKKGGHRRSIPRHHNRSQWPASAAVIRWDQPASRCPRSAPADGELRAAAFASCGHVGRLGSRRRRGQARPPVGRQRVRRLPPAIRRLS
jgi:hypothetical protein